MSSRATRSCAGGGLGSRWACCAPLAAVCCTALSFLGCGRGGEPPFGPHPIVILDIDTLRADHLGCYGYPRDTSPRIDALAAEAVRFEWAFSQAPNTLPSQTSILTGLYPSTHRVQHDDDRVNEEIATLAEVLLDQGFRTAAFVDGGYLDPAFGLHQGFEIYDDNRGKGLAAIGPKAIAWLEQNADESFLLFLHTYDVHSPYDPPEPFRSVFLDGLQPSTPGFEPTSAELESVRHSQWSKSPRSLSPADLAYTVALYDGGIRFVDGWVGAIVHKLKELGLYERATLVLLSDHGEEFQEHGSVLHDKLYATVTRIPLLVRLPGATRRGWIVRSVVESIDVMPTLLELVGSEALTGLPGQSLMPLLLGETASPRLAFGESPYFGNRRFVADEHYRLLLTLDTAEVELYRFRRDPTETTDVSAEARDAVVRLRAAFFRWQEAVTRQAYPRAAALEIDPETREHLEALGYIP